MLPLLDTLQHLILPDRFDYPWTAELPALAGRGFDFGDYREATRNTGVAGSIIMEAAVDDADYVAEARALAAIARQPGSGILGIIASARPENAAGFDAWIEEGADLGIIGYRRVLHVCDDDVSRSTVFRNNVRKLGARGIPLDAVFLARQLPIARELAGTCDITEIVLDHCGNPDIAGGELDSWRAEITELARLPNVRAKLSGVFACCAPGAASLENVRPYVEHVIAAFGPDRCLWGSDWPVVTATGSDLPTWIAAIRAILDGFSDAEATAMASGTAELIYDVRLP